MQQKQSVLNIF